MSSSAESGVDLDFDKLLEDDDFVASFYELKCKPISSSPAPELKETNMTLRTTLRLQLMRQEALEQERREQQMVQEQQEVARSVSSAIQTPGQTSVANTQQISASVPPHVLQVKTGLLHPTKYHVQENQKRQLQMYLSHEMGKSGQVQSLPAGVAGAGGSAPSMGIHSSNMLGSSAPVGDPDSPLSVGMSSTATSVSEVEELLGDIISLEAVESCNDNDLSYIEPSLNHLSNTLPQTTSFVDQMYDGSDTQSSTQSSSCPPDLPQGTRHHGGRQRQEAPPFMTNDEARSWAKERQKKDNHNQIERRRRFNINDRIKELGTLLPKHIDPDLRQNKGTILKASVDYIRRLQRDHDRMRQMEDRQRQMEATNRKLLLRMQEMELMMKQHGISGNNQSMTSDLLNDMLQQQAPVQVKQEVSPQISQVMAVAEDMDDNSPIAGDPMLSSSSPGLHPQHYGNESMDDSDMLV